MGTLANKRFRQSLKFYGCGQCLRNALPTQPGKGIVDTCGLLLRRKLAGPRNRVGDV